MNTKILVERLFAQPTAPFREGWVLHEISAILKEKHIPFFQDQSGNIVAGVKAQHELGQSARLALQAHTDHPGFHLTERLGALRWRGLWFGGAPFKTMKGARLRIYDPERPGFTCEAICEKIQSESYTREGMPIVIKLRKKEPTLTTACFGAFAFPAYDFRGDQIRTRVADDLSGVVIALGALIDQKRRGLKNALAVFTRAEEVGFVGCLKLMQQKLLPARTWVLCLEASRELPLARMGEGPVLRLGDRSTIYDSDFSVWMWKVAEQLRLKNAHFKYQRRLMDGGSCEATAMSLYEYTTSGLAVPLRNYHNQGANRPQPEVISLSDLEGARQLCGELYREFHNRPLTSRDLMKSLNQNCRELTPLLKRQIHFATGADR